MNGLNGFWRDQTGHEIDLLIDTGGRLFPVAIELATLVHGGNESFTRNGVAVRPWFSV